jgi:hypothetical protein
MSQVGGWFNSFVNDLLIGILHGLSAGYSGELATVINDYLDGLNIGEEIAPSPLVKVLDKDGQKIRFLIRGRLPMFGGKASAFMRIDLSMMNHVENVAGRLQVNITDWHTIIGDLQLTRANVFEAVLALGYDQGVWLGRGKLKIIPAQTGVDIFLGGLSDRGAMVGLGVDFPVPIPLGCTGMGIMGLGGDFAYNFIPRLVPAANEPQAITLLRWARDINSPDRWQEGPLDQTAVGVGVDADLVTLLTQGRLVRLDELGLAVLTPGPTFILGGTGKLMDGVANLDGYLVVDIPSAAMALGLSAQVKVDRDKGQLVDGKGMLDAYFSFRDPGAWYLNIGTELEPIRVSAIAGAFKGEFFLMLNNHRLHIGAGVAWGWRWKKWCFKASAYIGLRLAALLGYNPPQIGTAVELWAELGFMVDLWLFEIGVIITGSARIDAVTPHPSKLEATFKCKIDLPWPIPDLSWEQKFSWSDEEIQPPEIQTPLLAGTSTCEGVTTHGARKLGALHPITGRQWTLTDDPSGAVWPDVEIVVPFAHQVLDDTQTIFSPVLSAELQGAYDVYHKLTHVELWDLVNNAPVPGPSGVWAASPDGSIAQLHLLGETPFHWLTPHEGPCGGAQETVGGVVEQDFRTGPNEQFGDERRFGELLVAPSDTAYLTDLFSGYLPTRLLACPRFGLRVATLTDQTIHFDRVTLLMVTAEDLPASLELPGLVLSPAQMQVEHVRDLSPTLRLIAVHITLNAPVAGLGIASTGSHTLWVYAIRYHEVRQYTRQWQGKAVLEPGHYRLTLGGESHAEGHPPFDDLPASKTVAWEVSQSFWVQHPESLRPYVADTTLGDRRLFQKEGSAWNPSLYGLGFPVYTGYQGVVRFNVPYISQIFPSLRIRLDYERKASQPGYSETIDNPKPNQDGLITAPLQSQAWAKKHGGAIPPDEEILYTGSYDEAGPARLTLWHDPAAGSPVRLEDWTCYVSRFSGFADHLAWKEPVLKVTYDAQGRAIHAGCAALLAYLADPAGEHSPEPVRIDGLVYILPEEYSTMPPGWDLPTSLASFLQPLDGQSGVRYARFAHATGVRFDNAAGDRLVGLNQAVAETAVEALLDAGQRPLCLWLRTPEPVDWRRVRGCNLQIQHVVQEGECPFNLSARWALDLSLSILPSPDASSAFLVGRFRDLPICLPRGVYTLKLEFDLGAPDLPRLRTAPQVGDETATLTFIQPFGQDWPLPPPLVSRLLPPHIEAMVRVLREIPELLVRVRHHTTLPQDAHALRQAMAGMPPGTTLADVRRALRRADEAYGRYIAARLEHVGEDTAELQAACLLLDRASLGALIDWIEILEG